MSRIRARFGALEKQGRKALIPYIVAGDPNLAITLPLMHALVAAGADIIELGVPFSDPMAEGPTIASGHERALAQGVSLAGIIDIVAEFRDTDKDTPVLLMGYTNPIERMGHGQLVQRCQQAGVDAVLVVDMPPEEVGPLHEHLKLAAMDNIFLIAPTTPEFRIAKVAEVASGFIYCVSLRGVTGAGNVNTVEVAAKVGEIKTCSNLPVAVGFGIKDAASASSIARVADGVVIGSALVQLIADVADASDDVDKVLDAARGLIADIRAGIDDLNVGQ